MAAPASSRSMTSSRMAEARLSDFRSMLDDIREQRDRWQQQAERLAHSRSRISGRNAHPRGLSRGGKCSELPPANYCFYGLWASSVGAFSFRLFVYRFSNAVTGHHQSRSAAEEPDHRHRRLPRPRREWPCCAPPSVVINLRRPIDVTSRGGHTHATEGRYYALVARSAATCQDRGTELVSTARTTK